jgi:hypothetical protein
VALNQLTHSRARQLLVGLAVLGAAISGTARASASTASAATKPAKAHCSSGWTLAGHGRGVVCHRGSTFRRPVCGSGAVLFTVPGAWLCAATTKTLPPVPPPPPPVA